MGRGGIVRISEFSQKNPAAVASASAIVLLFGTLALLRLPIQLLPDTRQPQLFINAEWREAAPSELEEALIEPIEEAMRGMPGLVEMSSESNRGRGGVRLSFEVGTDLTRVMLDVVSRLNTLPPLPPDADEPQVFGGDNWQAENAGSLLIRPLPGNDVPDLAAVYQKMIEEVVEPRLARAPGVSRVNLEGGRPSEVQIRFDPHRLAALGITPQRIAETVIAARDVSAGFADVGRRQFTVRVTGREPVAQLGDLVVGWSEDRPLYLRDVADVSVNLVDARWFSYRNGEPSYYITLQRTSESNTVELIDGVKVIIDELNAGPLAKEKLFIELSWDASVYVRRAIGFVRESLVLGIVLAVGALWYFLRGPRALLVIGAAIPLSLLFAVIALHLLGRTLNVVSLAGLAFSTGIVVDAALIVQGNVLRYVQEGREPMRATLDGTSEVMPALMTSMLTSIAIFLPILFMEGLEGQLFKDLAITMSVSHAASLLVAATLIPAANRWALARTIPADRHNHWWIAMADFAMRLTQSPRARWGWIGGFVGASLLAIWLLAPRVDYLPVAQTDMIWNNFQLPPGGNNATARTEFAPVVIERLRPHLEGNKHPAVKYYNFSAWGGQGGTAVVYPKDPRDIKEMVRVMREEIMIDFPDTKVYIQRGSLLNVDGDNAREIRLDFQGPDLAALMTAARVAVDEIPNVIAETYPRPEPALELNQPELQLRPNEWRVARSGMTRSEVAAAVRAYTGGLWAGEYFDGNERLDIIVKAREWRSPEELAELPIATPGSGVQTVGELAEIRQTVGPSQLRRINGRRTVSVGFEPPEDMTLDEAMSIVRDTVEPKVRAAMTPDVQLTYAGTANELHEALRSMSFNFLLALVILFALMAALFRSLRDSVLVLLVMPASVAGGILALRAIGLFTFQALDLLTMIGFIILLGLVVNAAILLVDQTRAREHAGVPRGQAVREALETRARPIVLSTLTSVLGMAPLIFLPGLGAEIYRGLAAVVAGGMVIGTCITWILMPSLLRLGETAHDAVAERQLTAGEASA